MRGFNNIDTPATKMMFYKTNFNMPTPSMLGGTWVRFLGPIVKRTPATSFSLTGFQPGYEICIGLGNFDWDNLTASSVSLSASLTVGWLDTDNSTVLYNIVENFSIGGTVDANSWREVFFAGTIGIAPWEIDSNSTYYFRTVATGTDSIPSVSTGVTITNVPTISTISSNVRGATWVEGNNLTFLNADGWKHSIAGTVVNTTPGTAKKGYMWIDTSNDLHWVGDNGTDYKVPWKKKQFASWFSNSATGEENAGTANKGAMWMDSEYGYTHIAYIGNDGFKYLCGAGDDPYA